ncbi:MAG: S8 family serine peptidase [Bacteroidales bacterium]|jgi:hypothetical protein|nr:S8 family serine peptidase [Bacteroidales bacterium]
MHLLSKISLTALVSFAAAITLTTAATTIVDTTVTAPTQEFVPDAIYIRYKQLPNKKSDDYVSKAKRAAEHGKVEAKVRSMSLFKNEILKRTVKIKVKNSEDLEKIIKQLEKEKDVEMIERIPIHNICNIYPNDSLYGTIDSVPLNWHLKMIGAEDAWALQHGNPNVKIAVIDNAVWGEHEDLQIKPENLYNVSTGETGSATPPVYDSTECKNSDNCPAYRWSHGTHCAGNVGAITNNGKGVASLGGGVTVMGVSCPGPISSNVYDGASGIVWAVENGAKIVSLSWGGSGSNTLENVIAECVENDIVVVAAAGNESAATLFYPAAYPGVISVASINSDTVLSSFSNYGIWVTIAAPGGTYQNSFSSILSTTYNRNVRYREAGYNALNGKYYDGMNGTSMACPIVASLCGLLLSHDTTLSAKDIRDILIATSVPLNSRNNKKIFPESGMINPVEALRVTGNTFPAPQNVEATIVSTGVNISWTAPNPDTFVFYRFYKNGILHRDTFQAEEFFDADVRSDNYYIYGVSAVYANGEESFHKTVNVVVPYYFYVHANIQPDSNAGTVTGLGTFRTGYDITLEAHAAAGYTFKEWNFYGIVRSTDSVYTFTLDKNQTLNAVFEENAVSSENISNAVNGTAYFNIFPNPVNDKLTIESKKNNFKATVFNDKGQMIFMRRFYSAENAVLDVAHLAKGIYFVSLDNQTIKFIKQ